MDQSVKTADLFCYVGKACCLWQQEAWPESKWSWLTTGRAKSELLMKQKTCHTDVYSDKRAFIVKDNKAGC